MRKRREGGTRVHSIRCSLRWNQNPVDPPGRGVTRRRVTSVHGQQIGSLTAEEKKAKRKEKKRLKTEEKVRKKKLREEQLQIRRLSEPIIGQHSKETKQKTIRKSFLQLIGAKDTIEDPVVLQTNHSSQRYRLTTLKEEDFHQSISAPLATREDIMGDDNADFDNWNGGGETNHTQSPSESTVESDPVALKDFVSRNNDSTSTLGTRRTSTAMSKDGSSRKFEVQKEDSMKFSDLFEESGASENDSDDGDDGDEDDGSISFEEIAGADDDSGNEDDDDDDEVTMKMTMVQVQMMKKMKPTALVLMELILNLNMIVVQDQDLASSFSVGDSSRMTSR